ncbi:cytochrome P450 2D18 [Lophiotrema nucula]|uniref:Cytochrome P450 2D18 n=1 Tax=Lophiotrema nucula TaxID=690887 RepID=A0A6A5Z5K4_9PLEO|nr:cytochrome P450 2D18 [Lophiotrema nucula]
MYSHVTTLLGFLYALFALYTLFKLFRFGQRDKRLPPGPPTLPILGNAHLIPAHGLHRKFQEWSDQYGKIFSLKIGASTIVVLNDRRAVHSLIDKKSAIYSDRSFDKNSDAAVGGENFGLQHISPSWRAQRKVAAQCLSPKVIDDKIGPIQEAEICHLVHDLLESPDQLFAHVKRAAASATAIVIFGHRASTANSFWGTLNTALEPGSYLPIEQFPILGYIPDFLAPSKARAREAYRNTTAIYKEAKERVETRRKNGDVRDSIADRLLSGDMKMDITMRDNQFSNFLAVLHEAGSDTTASMVLTGILYLAKHPWVQDKARLELDRACGQRMPAWSDFKDLPYINCIIKEGLRIRPVAPVGIPHRVNCDDWYEGFLIPKDSTIYLPPWTLNKQCEDPDTYNPDRYLQHPRLAMDYAGSPDYENRDHYSYGSGRRVCVGIHLAERTQWRILARLLWAFNIEPPVDESGKVFELGYDYVDAFLSHPVPYNVRFTPRSAYHERVVRESFVNVKDFLGSWE